MKHTIYVVKVIKYIITKLLWIVEHETILFFCQNDMASFKGTITINSFSQSSSVPLLRLAFEYSYYTPPIWAQRAVVYCIIITELSCGHNPQWMAFNQPIYNSQDIARERGPI